jgi:hypothetical protein
MSKLKFSWIGIANKITTLSYKLSNTSPWSASATALMPSCANGPSRIRPSTEKKKTEVQTAQLQSRGHYCCLTLHCAGERGFEEWNQLKQIICLGQFLEMVAINSAGEETHDFVP